MATESPAVIARQEGRKGEEKGLLAVGQLIKEPSSVTSHSHDHI